MAESDSTVAAMEVNTVTATVRRLLETEPSRLWGCFLAFITLIFQNTRLVPIYNHGSQKFWRNEVSVHKLLVLYQFFHENHQFIEAFEIMEMGDSLILIPPPLPLPPKKKSLNQNQQFSDSELFEKPE